MALIKGRIVGIGAIAGVLVLVVVAAIVAHSQWWRARQARAAFERADNETRELHERFLASEAERAKEAAAAKNRAQAHEATLAEQFAARQAEIAKEHEAAIAALQAKTPAERVEAIRTECAGDCRHYSLVDIVGAGATDAERTSLKRLADAAEVKAVRAHQVEEAKVGRENRKSFASTYETALFEKHLNPDGVSTSGDNSTTLVVRGWFCSRQFMYDAQNNGLADQAKAVGFKRIECYSGLESAWLDL
jgi:hypothetical protein